MRWSCSWSLCWEISRVASRSVRGRGSGACHSVANTLLLVRTIIATILGLNQDLSWALLDSSVARCRARQPGVPFELAMHRACGDDAILGMVHFCWAFCSSENWRGYSASSCLDAGPTIFTADAPVGPMTDNTINWAFLRLACGVL
jgi:hypothetical protein